MLYDLSRDMIDNLCSGSGAILSSIKYLAVYSTILQFNSTYRLYKLGSTTALQASYCTVIVKPITVAPAS